MVETSTGAVEDGKPTKPGSSIWFMTESKDRHVVSEYWLSALGHDIEVENHFAQINAWKAAPFKTYVVEQRVGDFILIPPLAPHQVWNRGTRTMKAAWNRTTVETLEMALDEALPRARMVCRDEQYKNKAIIYYTLVKYSRLLTAAEGLKERKNSDSPPTKILQLQKDFRRLHTLITRVLVSESFPHGQEEKKVEFIPYDSNITCSYCRCNIFNRFLTCPSCIGELPNGEEDTYDICLECYAVGRSCRCISKLRWVEQFSWADLTKKHEQWRRQIIHLEGQITPKSPMSLKVEVERHEKRTLAEICQIELKKRPWHDVKKPIAPIEPGNESDEVEVNGEGVVGKKKRKPRQSEKFKREHKLCHFHTIWEPRWKQIECTQCEAAFCYGTLARAFDLKPQELLAEKQWKCPKCRRFCICRKCREKPGWKMVEPPRTMLGHDTKKVADPRSVESLVDYSQSNISWLQKVGDDGTNDTRRLERRKQAAEKAKAQKPALGDDYVEDEPATGQDQVEVEQGVLRLAEHEGIPVDPALANWGGEPLTDSGSHDEDEQYNENPEEASLAEFYETSQNVAPQPQDVIPAGGIIRNAQHAYDYTDAITYDYPDPDFDVPATPTERPKPPTSHVVPGYEPAVPLEGPTRIEMVHRKRKRSSVDLRDDPTKSQKRAKNVSRKSNKAKKSLVVKLSINKGRLAELNKILAIAQGALNGVEEDVTPVIGSDLRALNVESGMVTSHQPTKKIRVERPDEDEDFTGPRVRKDRQRAVPAPLTLPTRRTRTQTIAYEEPSDGEDDEESSGDGGDQSARRPQPDANQGEKPFQSSSPTIMGSNETAASSPADAVMVDDLPEGKTAARMSAEATPAEHAEAVKQWPVVNRSGRLRTAAGPNRTTTTSSVINQEPSRDEERQSIGPCSLSSSPVRNIPKEKLHMKAPGASEAEKNRKAKLAAMYWGQDNSNGLELESESSCEEESLFVPETRSTQTHTTDTKSRTSLPKRK